MGNVSRNYWESIYLEYNNSYNHGTNSNDSTEGFWANKFSWYQWLCKDEFFMDMVRQRWVELLPITLNLVRENKLGISRIDYFVNSYKDAIIRNYQPIAEGGAGWRFDAYGLNLEYDYLFEDYNGSVEYLRDWLLKRIIWLDISFNRAPR